MPRRNRIPFEHRERLVRAFEDVNEDYLIVADTLGINRSTARSVSRYIREGRIAERPRGGPNHVRVDNEMRDCLNDILNENCLLTLTQLNQLRIETTPSSKTQNLRPHCGKNFGRNVVSYKTGQACSCG